MAKSASPVRYILLEEDEMLPRQFKRLVETAKHMSDDKTVFELQAGDGSVMLRFNQGGVTRQLTVKPCLPEPMNDSPFVCGAASIDDSLAAYYVEGLTAAGQTAIIHRTVAGHPIIQVIDKGMFRVELSQ
jgi:hypothetical protein